VSLVLLRAPLFIKVVSILNYMEHKDKVMELIQDKLGWVYYGKTL
jgi:hypothetical protein